MLNHITLPCLPVAQQEHVRPFSSFVGFQFDLNLLLGCCTGTQSSAKKTLHTPCITESPNVKGSHLMAANMVKASVPGSAKEQNGDDIPKKSNGLMFLLCFDLV